MLIWRSSREETIKKLSIIFGSQLNVSELKVSTDIVLQSGSQRKMLRVMDKWGESMITFLHSEINKEYT